MRGTFRVGMDGISEQGLETLAAAGRRAAGESGLQEALETLGRYLDDAALAGLARVTVIHGLGTGALRDAVRAEAGGHPLVKSVRPGERGEGGDGATIVEL